MRNWTIGRKLAVGVGLLLALLGATGWLAIATAATIKHHLDVASRKTSTKIGLAHEIQETVIRLRSEQRRALVAGFGKDKATVIAVRARIADLARHYGEQLDAIAPLLITEEGKTLVLGMREVGVEWTAVNEGVMARIARGEVDAAWSDARDKANPLIDRIDEAGDTLLQQQQAFLAAANESADASYARARLVLLAVFGVAAAAGVGVSLVVRGIVRELRATASNLRQGAEQVSAASSQVAMSSQSLSQGATEQAASIEETSASMEEMASMTRSNAEGAERAAALTASVEGELARANERLADMVGAMSEIRASSTRVALIIKTIDEIAFQTNLLALNAAVEAARAGEAGMGFAVVADEVRTLAQRAAEAARNTAELIESSGRSAEAGAARVEETAKAIRSLSHGIGEVRSLSEQVNRASSQQRQGIDQVSQAMAQMEKVTQASAATAEETAAASEELNAQAETSMESVRRLDAMVGGARSVAARAVAPRRRGTVVTLSRRDSTRPEADAPAAAVGAR